MARTHEGWRTLTVILTAYVLVLQLLLAGFSSGAQAAALDTVHGAGLICSGLGSADVPVPADGPPPLHDGSTCCTLGCPMSGAASALPPAVSVEGPARLAAQVDLPLPAPRPAPPAHRQAGNPARAPPLSA